MLELSLDRKIYLYRLPADMRKSINGLDILVSKIFSNTISNGDLFLFVNRSRDKLKLLTWDTNGFVLYYKRLEKGRFQPYWANQNDRMTLNALELKQPLSGLNMEWAAKYPGLRDRFFS